MKQSVPAGKNKVSQFDFVNNLIQRELRQLLEGDAPKNEAEARAKSRMYYKSCVDRDSINANSVKAMKKMVDDLGGLLLTVDVDVDAKWNLDDLLAKRSKYSLSSFFSVGVGADDKNVSTNIIQISQGGLGLGDDTRDYYLNKTVEKDPVMLAYATMLQKYAEIVVGESNVQMAEIFNVLRFEQELAKIQLSQAEMRDPNANYHKLNIAWLQKNSKFTNWVNLFNSIFAFAGYSVDSDQPVLVYSTHYIQKIVSVVEKYLSTAQGKRTLQNYVVLMVLNDYAPNLSDDFQAAYNKFRTVYAGTQGAPETWQNCVSDTDSSLGFALGAIYVDKYFTAKEKKKAAFVIDSIIGTFRTRVENVCDDHISVI